MKVGNKVAKVVVGSIDLKKLANGLLKEVVEEAIDEVVKGTETTFDDMAKAAMWPVLEEKMKKIIEEKLDLSKLLKLDEASSES